MVATATITSKGQMTIPRAVRDLLQLEPGDRVELVPLPDGGVRMRRKSRSLDDFVGMLSERAGDRPVDRAVIDATVEEAMEEEDRRVRGSS